MPLPFTLQHESEFLSRGFELSPAHDPNEAILSYCRRYPDDQVLTVTLSIGLEPKVHVSMSNGSVPFSVVEMENVTDMAFQSWHGERTLRFYFSRPEGITDLRVHYEPEPKVYVSVLA